MTEYTISAIATPPGKGGVGIIRISGVKAKSILTELTKKKFLPRYATYTKFYDENNQVIDIGLGLFFPSPHSFTGEDVVELHGHGGPVVLDLLLKRTLELGARIALPGEFSKRAFLNNKIDLTQAEAIADLIESTTSSAAKSAINSLQGEFSNLISELDKKIVELRMYIEAAIDFPDEEVDFLSDGAVANKLSSLQDQILSILQNCKQGLILKEGINLVIVGPPNAGKSSLLNVLCQNEVAIVTDTPGTTRDVVQQDIIIDGLPIKILDTAGIRESQDEIELEGMRRAKKAIELANLVLIVIDDHHIDESVLKNIISTIPTETKILIVKNKIDLTNTEPKVTIENNYPTIYLSAKLCLGLNILYQEIKKCSEINSEYISNFTARRRHINALEETNKNLSKAINDLNIFPECVAEELKLAHQHLNDITGKFTPDDLLGVIFSSFCIGK